MDAVLQVCEDKEAMLAQAIELAVMIASKSPVSAQTAFGCCAEQGTVFRVRIRERIGLAH